MTPPIVRGATVTINATVWLDKKNKIPMPLAGNGGIKTIVKKNPRDVDADALFVKSLGAGIAILDAPNGQIQIVFTAADTNVIAQNRIYYETIAKLADGSFNRSGIDELEVEGNALKTLF